MEKEFEELSRNIIGAAIEVHKRLGPGFLESIYQSAMKIQLRKDRLPFESQKEVKIYYDDKEIGTHRIDLIVGGEIIVELKAVDVFSNSHLAQVISYLKATGLRVGLLLNFSKSKIEVKRVVK